MGRRLRFGARGRIDFVHSGTVNFSGTGGSPTPITPGPGDVTPRVLSMLDYSDPELLAFFTSDPRLYEINATGDPLGYGYEEFTREGRSGNVAIYRLPDYRLHPSDTSFPQDDFLLDSAYRFEVGKFLLISPVNNQTGWRIITMNDTHTNVNAVSTWRLRNLRTDGNAQIDPLTILQAATTTAYSGSSVVDFRRLKIITTHTSYAVLALELADMSGYRLFHPIGYYVSGGANFMDPVGSKSFYDLAANETATTGRIAINSVLLHPFVRRESGLPAE